MPFADSVFTRGRASANRPLLLIEPSYKINGEDKTKSQTRPARSPNAEQDNKTVARTTPDNLVDVKGGPSEFKTKEKQTSDPKEKEASLSDAKADYALRDMSYPDSRRDQKIAETPIYDVKPGDKVVDKTLSKSGDKVGSKTGEVSSSSSSAPGTDNVTETNSNKKRPKNVGREGAPQNTVVDNSSSAVVETSGNKAKQSISSLKQTERLPDVSRSVMEDNIVLGVALDGSKRTLPIEEGMSSSAPTPEFKEFATSRSGSMSPMTDKNKKDGQNSTVPDTAPADK